MKDSLEEAAENSFLANKLENSNAVEKAHYIAGFREGAKWKKERSYSEEELKLAWEDGRNGTKTIGTPPFVITKFQYNSFSKWFEQFKK